MKLKQYQEQLIDKALAVLYRHRLVYLAMETRTGKTPQCGIEMEPCDYSPLYGYSWVHPKTENDCKYKDGTLLFGGHKLKEGGNTQ